MKKRILLMVFALCLAFNWMVYAEETGKCYYMNDYLSFCYPEDIFGTITMEELSGTLYYHCDSYTDIFGTDIRIINKETYFKNLEVSQENYKDKIFDKEMHTLTDNKECLEYRDIDSFDGTVDYLKILGESDNSFVLVAFDGINDNPSRLGDAFKMIYDSVKLTDYYLENGFEPKGFDYERVIYGKRE